MSTPSNLQETALYQRLCYLVEEIGQINREKENRQKALSLTNDICSEASEIMKMTPTFSPEYTLHDETHLLHVTHLMGIVLEKSGSLEQLSYLEITILILAAFLHDIGMAPPREKFKKIISSSEFSVFRKTRLRELEGLQELLNLLENPSLSIGEKQLLNLRAAEIEQSIFTEYLRNNHGIIGADEIVEKWSNDPRWEVEGYNLAETVAWVCKGHSFHTQQLVTDYSDNYPLDKLIGQKEVNILYCTIILRLSDILDFDRERTPQILYKNISPRNEISIKEWNKHKSVTGWRISNSEIIFECECTHPVYEKTLRSFLDYIDSELTACHFLVDNFPQRNQIAEHYKLKLPPIVGRTKIKVRNNTYSYLDLSFSLSHEEIMKFLMGKELWGGTSLCVRELIQNSYDAIRHRRALELAAGNDWIQGKITLIQRLNEKSHLEFECRDNGMGMNHHILKNYFFKVGRSYYLSPEFEQERAGLKEQNADFDPVSQFGIGIVSTFLIGNSLHIRTQRYLGPNRGCEKSLLVEIDGFSQMAVISTLPDKVPRPGTEINVIGKKMSYEEASDKWFDPLNLLGAAQFYAAALDIPIEVIVEPPFNACHLMITPPTRPLRLRIDFEDNPDVPLEHYTILERDFSLMSNDCEGTAKVFFLRDKHGRLCVKNEWGFWEKKVINKNNAEIMLVRVLDGKTLGKLGQCRAVIAQDGILVSSSCDKRDNLYFNGTRYPAPYYIFPGSFFINLHGKAKLPLKPNRAPYQPSLSPKGKEETIWWNFERRLYQFISDILEDVLCNNDISPDPINFWSIVHIYDLSLYGLSKETAYSYIFLPSNINGNQLTWVTLNSLYSQGLKYISLGLQNSASINIGSFACIPLSGFGIELCDDATFERYITSIVRATTIMRIEDGLILYEIKPLSTPFNRLFESHSSTSVFDWKYFQVYSDDLQEYLSINNPAGGMNYNHPVAQFIIESHNMITDTYKWFRWGIVIIVKELVNDKNFDEKQPSEWGENTLRNVRLVISHWKKVKWDELPIDLKPPYRILFPSSGRSYDISIEYLEERIKNLGIKEKIQDTGLANLE